MVPAQRGLKERYNPGMADLERLYRNRGTEKAMEILAKATKLAKDSPDIYALDLQHELEIGYSESVVVLDWLADTGETQPKVSHHWIRQGRRYVLNDMAPSLSGMALRLELGERRAYRIMQVLEQRGVLRIKDDFTFERIGRMASFADLIAQLKVVGKKYQDRCEPSLIVRTLYVDPLTAIRLAQYGEEFLGLRWRGRPKEVL